LLGGDHFFLRHRRVKERVFPKSQAGRASAMLFARAMRKASHRIADKVVESPISPVTAATDRTVILFIASSPARVGLMVRRDGKNCLGIKELLVWTKPAAAIVYMIRDA
jgi:hypothetical protein